MMELVDMLRLERSAVRRGGSSPPFGKVIIKACKLLTNSYSRATVLKNRKSEVAQR